MAKIAKGRIDPAKEGNLPYKVGEAKSKFVYFWVLASLLLLAGFCFFIKLNKENIHTVDVTPYQVSDQITYAIEQNTVAEYGVITGYAYLEGEALESVDVTILLYHEPTNEYIGIPTELQTNETLKNINTRDFSNAGFYAKVKTDKLVYTADSYRIYILYKNNNHKYLVNTNQYLGVQK